MNDAQEFIFSKSLFCLAILFDRFKQTFFRWFLFEILFDRKSPSLLLLYYFLKNQTRI